MKTLPLAILIYAVFGSIPTWANEGDGDPEPSEKVQSAANIDTPKKEDVIPAGIADITKIRNCGAVTESSDDIGDAIDKIETKMKNLERQIERKKREREQIEKDCKCSTGEKFHEVDDSISKADDEIKQLTKERTKKRKSKGEAETCERKQKGLKEDQNEKEECLAKNKSYREKGAGMDFYKWDSNKKECIGRAEVVAALDEEGECNNANVFKNTDLKGQHCGHTLNVMKEVTARNKTLSDTATAVTTLYATQSAAKYNGNQADAQAAQGNTLKMMAISKLASGISQVEGGNRLRTAANDAEQAGTTMLKIKSAISNECKAEESKYPSTAACFKDKARKYNLDDGALDRANERRLRLAASQSKETAERASALAKTNMITGLADAVVGIQAYKMAQQVNAQQSQMGALGPPPPIMKLPNNTAQSYVGTPIGFAVGTKKPEETGVGGGATLPTLGVGKIRGGIEANGKGYAKPNGAAARSVVSGGGGGGGGGGGRGGAPGAKNKDKDHRNSPTSSGEYNLGASGFLKATPMGKGDKGGDKGDSAIADVLKKMFPTDKNGAPVVDPNHVGDTAAADPDADNGAIDREPAADEEPNPTIFEMVTSRYRKLTEGGKI